MTKKHKQETKNKKLLNNKELETLKHQIEEFKNKYLRVLADFENYKKISAREKQQFAQFANETLIMELLPVVDGFSRAMKVAGLSEDMNKGLALIKKQLEDVLKKHGAEEIEASGKPFDPNFHEAILQQEHDGPEGMIIEEAQKGYKLKGKVIRPSMVIVSKNKEENTNG
ncbi:nucleotide exchange factor GrpE [Candidatus Margulisiibacteriota bacterium]